MRFSNDKLVNLEIIREFLQMVRSDMHEDMQIIDEVLLKDAENALAFLTGYLGGE